MDQSGRGRRHPPKRTPEDVFTSSRAARSREEDTNAITGQTVFPNPRASFAVIVAWGAAGYALLM